MTSNYEKAKQPVRPFLKRCRLLTPAKSPRHLRELPRHSPREDTPVCQTSCYSIFFVHVPRLPRIHQNREKKHSSPGSLCESGSLNTMLKPCKRQPNKRESQVSLLCILLAVMHLLSMSLKCSCPSPEIPPNDPIPLDGCPFITPRHREVTDGSFKHSPTITPNQKRLPTEEDGRLCILL